MPRGRGRCRSGLLTLRATANRKNWGLFRLAVRSLAAPPASAPKRRYAAPAPRVPRPSHATAQLSEPSLGSGMQRRSKRAREMMKRCRFCRFAQMPPSQEHTHAHTHTHTLACLPTYLSGPRCRRWRCHVLPRHLFVPSYANARNGGIQAAFLPLD